MESAFCGYCEVEELFSVVYLVAYTTVKMKNVETEKKKRKTKNEEGHQNESARTVEIESKQIEQNCKCLL